MTGSARSCSSRPPPRHDRHRGFAGRGRFKARSTPRVPPAAPGRRCPRLIRQTPSFFRLIRNDADPWPIRSGFAPRSVPRPGQAGLSRGRTGVSVRTAREANPRRPRAGFGRMAPLVEADSMGPQKLPLNCGRNGPLCWFPNMAVKITVPIGRMPKASTGIPRNCGSAIRHIEGIPIRPRRRPGSGRKRTRVDLGGSMTSRKSNHCRSPESARIATKQRGMRTAISRRCPRSHRCGNRTMRSGPRSRTFLKEPPRRVAGNVDEEHHWSDLTSHAGSNITPTTGNVVPIR
jgi:hypothetical protein